MAALSWERNAQYKGTNQSSNRVNNRTSETGTCFHITRR